MSARLIPTSTGSSPACAAELITDRKARRTVLAVSWLLMLAGTSMIAQLEISVLVRVVSAFAWVAGVGRSLGRLARGQARVATLSVVADGPCRGRSRKGEIYELQLLAGSIVGRQGAWLRFRFADGLVYAELLWSWRVEASAWRRLNVLWRWSPLS